MEFSDLANKLYIKNMFDIVVTKRALKTFKIVYNAIIEIYVEPLRGRSSS